MSIEIRITKFGDSRSLLGKRVSLSAEGQYLKESVVTFSQGFFETITSDWKDFDKVLTSLNPNETLGLGVCCKVSADSSLPMSMGTIVTAKKELTSRGSECSRTLANFSWHKNPCKTSNVIMIDIDEDVTSFDAAYEELFDLYPELGKLPGGSWAMASAGAYIKNTITGEWVTELSGIHIYFVVPNSIEVSTIKQYLQVSSWLADAGKFKVNTHRFGHTLLERHFIDMSVFSPERLDFIGGSACGEGLAQERPAPAWREQPFSGVADFSVSDEEVALANHLRSECRFKIEGKLPPVEVTQETSQFSDFVAAGELPGMFQLTFDSGEVAHVWEIIADPDKYHGKTMSDPLFPEKGRCKAKYYFNGDGDAHARHVVNSFVKGGQRFFLTLGVDGALEMVQRFGEVDLKRMFGSGGRGWEEVVSLDLDTELPALLEALKHRGIGKLAELKAHLGKAAAGDVAVQRQAVLEEFNRKYAYVDVGNKPRLLEVVNGKVLLRTRNDFVTAVENVRVPVVKKSGVTYEAASDEWLRWRDKRMYGGLEFNPLINDSEFERNGVKIFNRFRGYSVQATEERACKRTHCNGQGCFKWFFSDEGWKPCKEYRSWTVWLATIHDSITGGDKAHTLWVMEWMIEMVQKPVPAQQRPGTALVVRGGQGTGKGSVIWPIMQILGDYSFQCDSMSEVTADFNLYMEDTILLFADEAVWGGSKKESGRLKRLITEDTINVQPKGIDRYKAVNYLRLYVSSNSEWVVPAEDDERRYTVFNATDAHRLDRAWFLRFKQASLSELLDEIYKWKITSELGYNLDTKALREQKQQGWSVYEEFLADAIDEFRYWDTKTNALEVSHTEIRTLFSERYQNHRDSYGLTPDMFNRRLRKYLMVTDADIRTDTKIRFNGESVPGFKFASFTSACAALGLDGEQRLRYKEG